MVDIIIEGSSGTKYIFEKYNFMNIPNIAHCVYIYAKENAQNLYIIYIGKTIRTMKERYEEHNIDGINECAGFNEANCILIHCGRTLLTTLSDGKLKAIEKDLLGKYNTPCNTQNN